MGRVIERLNPGERDQTAPRHFRPAGTALALSLCLIGAGAWLQLIGGQTRTYAWGFQGYEGILGIVFALVGGVVATRRPSNPVGLIFSLAGLVTAIQYFTAQYSFRAVVVDPGLPGAGFSTWVQDWIWVPPTGLVGLLFLLFPHERLSDRGSRRVAVAGSGAAVAAVLAWALLPPRLETFDLDNPAGLLSDPALAEAIAGLATLVMMLCVGAAGLMLLARFRRSTGMERQQLKWFVFASAIASLGLIVSVFPQTRSAGSYFAVGGLALVPIATGIAILRHRLYDIDRIIKRTLVYAVLTATLGALYFAAVVVLQGVLRPVTGTSTLAVACSTLIVAALFGPVRSRVQTLIDRHFYRRSYDAAQTFDAFSKKLREEVDFDALRQELLGVTAQTMQPAHVSLWLQSPHDSSEE
ncbi:MAG: hypothetical protein ACRDKZ_06170 [Actinomycetota bacterium]